MTTISPICPDASTGAFFQFWDAGWYREHIHRLTWAADDLAVIAETEEELIKRLNDWKENVESKGM